MIDESGRLTREEGQLTLSLFARHCEHDIDQVDLWRITLPSGGDVYIDVSDGLPSGAMSRDAYRKVWPPQPEA